jgi:hypothetical protein
MRYIGEIFGVARFSSFSTQSANNGLRYRGKWHHQSSRQHAARRAREWLGQLPSRTPGVIEAGDREVTGFERIPLTSGKVANRRH